MRAARLAAILLAGALLLLADPAEAQRLSIDLEGAGGSQATARLVQLTVLIGLLSLAPSLLVMATAFARIAIVLSLLRSALGVQGIPPNPVLIGMALFLTLFVMQPVFDQAWTQGIEPMMQGQLGEIAGLQAAAEPFRTFMASNVREADLQVFLDLAQMPPPADGAAPPWRALMPAFLASELRRAFEIGFLIFLPFLVIDLVVASVLMGLGMMMLPPPAVSLPFKLVFFVIVDGWQLVCGSLVQGFSSI
jgi:flagellar biosynthetic protein FliP